MNWIHCRRIKAKRPNAPNALHNMPTQRRCAMIWWFIQVQSPFYTRIKAKSLGFPITSIYRFASVQLCVYLFSARFVERMEGPRFRAEIAQKCGCFVLEMGALPFSMMGNCIATLAYNRAILARIVSPCRRFYASVLLELAPPPLTMSKYPRKPIQMNCSTCVMSILCAAINSKRNKQNSKLCIIILLL